MFFYLIRMFFQLLFFFFLFPISNALNWYYLLSVQTLEQRFQFFFLPSFSFLFCNNSSSFRVFRGGSFLAASLARATWGDAGELFEFQPTGVLGVRWRKRFGCISNRRRWMARLKFILEGGVRIYYRPDVPAKTASSTAAKYGADILHP